jgi:hypothetical protein
MFLPLDGPAVYGALSVTDTPSELKVGASVLGERKVVTIQPLDGPVYFGYDNSVSETTGVLVREGQYFPLEAGDSLPVWLVAESGDTVDVRITEVG